MILGAKDARSTPEEPEREHGDRWRLCGAGSKRKPFNMSANSPSLLSTVDAGADRRSGWMIFCLANVHIMREIVIRGRLLDIHHLLNERRGMFCKLHNSIRDSRHNFVRP